jgi:hypothetical protein
MGLRIMKPNFEAMSKAELRAYVLAHRDDTEAFHALADRIVANPNLKWYSAEDVDRFPEIFAEHQKKKREQANES